MNRRILLNPGPVNISERVRNALLRDDLCHREKEFIELQNNIRQKLLDVYELSNRDWVSILMTGSGTAAVEAMITSLIPEDGNVLILENGVYGERMSRIANVYGINHTSLHNEWLNPINFDELSNELNKEKFTYVAVVHHETTTGRLNALGSIADICKEKNIPLLLDGVSSFGAESIYFNEWNIAACAATANKCLHGVPGTSFVIANRQHIGQAQSSARNLYLDLNNYFNIQENDDTPFTQSVQTFYALDEALNELKDEGGWSKRQENYWKLLKIVREGLTAIDIKPLLAEKECSCVLNAFHLPEGVIYDELHDNLKAQGFVIYAGQAELAKSLFRVSCMGTITTEDMQRFISSFTN